MDIMAFGNSVARVWGLDSIDDYCSITLNQTLSSSLKRCWPSNPTLQTPRNVPTANARCQLCQAGSIESGRRHNNRPKENNIIHYYAAQHILFYKARQSTKKQWITWKKQANWYWYNWYWDTWYIVIAIHPWRRYNHAHFFLYVLFFW